MRTEGASGCTVRAVLGRRGQETLRLEAEGFVDATGTAGPMANLIKFGNGILMINTCSGVLSTVMAEKEVDALCEVVLGGIRRLKGLGPPGGCRG